MTHGSPNLPAVTQYSVTPSRWFWRIFYMVVVLAGGGCIVYFIFDFSLQKMAITLVVMAAMGGFTYSELSSITARLRLEPDAFIFSTLFGERRIHYTTVKGFARYFDADGGTNGRESKGIQLVPEKGRSISVHDQFNDYLLLKDWVISNFVDLKAKAK